jgi:NADPH-dependent 2,4-dienoyl-CoA reductase/sulfur reductase-like enzyme
MMVASDTRTIVIVGAGPSGLATALSLAEGGASPLLFDMTANRLRAPPGMPEPMRRAFDERVARAGAAIAFRQASVFHAEPGAVWIHAEGKAERIPFGILVLATGSVPALAPAKNGDWAEIGQLPDNRLAAALGCDHAFDSQVRWLLPVRGNDMTASIADVYLPGTALLDDAVAEGERVAARILGRPAESRPAKSYPLGWSWPADAALPDDAVICTCNAVTVAAVRLAIASGARTLHHLGQYGGAGAGHCRGRKCQVALAHLLVEQTGLALADVLTPPAEFPAITLPLSVFADITPERPPATAPARDIGVLW